MTKKMTKKLINVLYDLSAIIVLVGAFCKIQHYSNGLSLLMFGITLGVITSIIENSRLKKIIKNLEKQLKDTNKDNEG